MSKYSMRLTRFDDKAQANLFPCRKSWSAGTNHPGRVLSWKLFQASAFPSKLEPAPVLQLSFLSDAPPQNQDRSGSIRINPGPSAPEEHRRYLKGFQKQDVSIDQIGAFIEEAKAYMNISETNKFSDDKLLVEVRGPDFQPLTLIDLPGLIHSVVKDDNVTVRNLASSYLGMPRSVILAIVHARTDIDNQEILPIIKEKDPAGERTIGVITKPDQIDDDDRDQFSLLARNEKYRLQRGWHVVRNRGSGEERSSFNQAKAEAEVFLDQPWKGLLPSQLGIENLRTRLSKVLLEETCKHLEPVIREVELQIADCGAQLELLGPTRASPGEQRSFLTDIREKFRARIYDGVEGHYTNPYYENHLDQRLRARVRMVNDQFDQNMRSHGHTFHIQEVMDKPTNTFTSAGQAPDVISAIAYLEDIDQSVVQNGRAQELPGRYNPDLVATVFRKQSIKWKAIARDHASSISRETERFLLQVLQGITETQIASRIWTGLVQPRLRKRQTALGEKVEELLKPFTDFLPFSAPQRYAGGLARFAKLRNQLEAAGREQKSIRDSVACTDLLIAMLAYYDSAMETFIDNIISLAVENCLLYDLSNLITPDVFATMKDEELKKYTEEPEGVMMRRHEADNKQQRLKCSLETFREQVWSAKSSLTAPSGFSLGSISGDASVIEITAQMNHVQVQMPESLPSLSMFNLNDGHSGFGDAWEQPPPATNTPPPAAARTSFISSPKSWAAPSPSFCHGKPDTLAPGIMCPSPAPSVSPNGRDRRKRSPRRPSSRIQRPEPARMESASDTGEVFPSIGETDGLMAIYV